MNKEKIIPKINVLFFGFLHIFQILQHYYTPINPLILNTPTIKMTTDPDSKTIILMLDQIILYGYDIKIDLPGVEVVELRYTGLEDEAHDDASDGDD